MKIGYFVPEFPGQTHAFFWREIGALREAGDEVFLFSTRRPSPSACPHPFGTEARAATHYVFPPAPGPALGLLARRPGRLAAALGYVAGLSETAPKRRAALLGGLIPSAADLAAACRRTGVRHVHFHSFAVSAHLGALAHILDDLSYSLTLHGDLPVYGTDHRHKLRHAAFSTAVTRPLAEQIAAVRPGLKVPVIPMGVDVERFRPGPTRSPGTPLLAVTVARLNRMKGHRFFLQAMAKAVGQGLEIRYAIAGDGPYRDTLVREIDEFGLRDRVDLMGSLREDEVLDLLQCADLFVLTSIGKGEAAPVSVMEAMACGLPVICSRIGGTEDMIADGVDGFLITQQDVDGIFAALDRLAREDGLATRVASAARLRAVEQFGHVAAARRLREEVAARIR